MTFGCPRPRQRLPLGKSGHRPQTWGGVLAKADQNTPDPSQVDPDWLLEIADQAKPAVRAAFLEALRRVRNTVQDVELRDAVQRGDVQAALRALGIDDALPAALKPGMTKGGTPVQGDA